MEVIKQLAGVCQKALSNFKVSAASLRVLARSVTTACVLRVSVIDDLGPDCPETAEHVVSAGVEQEDRE